MPTYEYLCQSCGARFEAWQKMSDDPIDTCPTCGNPVRRIIFPVGLVFKGSGFYINDTRSATPASSTGDAAPSSEAGTAEAGAGKPEASQSTSPADSTSSGSRDSSGGSDKPSASTAAGASPTTSGK